MGLFDKLFGKSEKKPAAQTTAAPAATAPPKQDELIRVHDKYGREYQITREQWRTSVLAGAVRSAWSKPDDLYNIIADALGQGFRADVVEAAKRLYEIDPDAVRCACVWGIVLIQEDRIDEAEKVFQGFIARHGENGVVLTNLAKVYAARKDQAKVEEILWRGLQLDPNQDNGALWYEAIHRERGGEEAGLEACRRIAALPGSWRAQLWLARAALKAKDLAAAVSLYQEVLARSQRPIPADLLMQMSGDLGNAGRLRELLQLVEPHFDVAQHGLQVGNNLIKANIDVGQVDRARAILDQLFAQRRPDWTNTLSFWDGEIAKANLEQAPIDPAQLQVGLLAFEGPVWLKPDSPARAMFGTRGDVGVVFVGGSAELPNPTDKIQNQLSDGPGRLSRATPFLLAEQVELASNAFALTFIHWMTKPRGGFVLAGAPWSDADVLKPLAQGDTKCSYAVISHIKANVEPSTVEVRVLRVADRECIGKLSQPFDKEHPGPAIMILARQLVQLLASKAQVQTRPLPAVYALPPQDWLSGYLLRVEQLIAVRCSSIEGMNPTFLSGQREIVTGDVQMCLAAARSVSVRLLLAETLLSMKRVRPEIMGEFKQQVMDLQREHPLSEPAQGIVQKMIAEAFSPAAPAAGA